MSITVVLTCVIITSVYLYLTRRFDYWKKRNIPYRKPIPLFGNSWPLCTVKQCAGDFLQSLYNSTTRPFFGFFVFDKPYLLIRDPELLKLVLMKNVEYFDDRSTVNYKRDDIGSNILLLLKNPDWRIVRSKVNPVFASGKMKMMYPLMTDAIQEMSNYLKEKSLKQKSIEFREVCMKFSVDVITSCAFGIDANCLKKEDAEFRQVSRRIWHWTLRRRLQTTCFFFAHSLVKLFNMQFIEPKAEVFLERTFGNIMKEREMSGKCRNDLIDLLIDLKNGNKEIGYTFDLKVLIAQAVQFFIAGFETIGGAIAISLYELSLHPPMQDRLRKEINDATKETNGVITYESIQEMKYLDMVVSETLRKYPLLPFVDRCCTQDYVIPGTDIVLDKGLPVYVSLLGLHHDPVYYPNPDKYDPERFTVENKALRPDFSYLPFGAGPRSCVGSRFGLLVSKAAVALLIQKFIVQPNQDTVIPLTFDVTTVVLSPNSGINLDFEEIHK